MRPILQYIESVARFYGVLLDLVHSDNRKNNQYFDVEHRDNTLLLPWMQSLFQICLQSVRQVQSLGLQQWTRNPI